MNQYFSFLTVLRRFLALLRLKKQSFLVAFNHRSCSFAVLLPWFFLSCTKCCGNFPFKYFLSFFFVLTTFSNFRKFVPVALTSAFKERIFSLCWSNFRICSALGGLQQEGVFLLDMGGNSAILPFLLSLWREMAGFTISSKVSWIWPMSFGQENYSVAKLQLMIRAYLFILVQVQETSKYGVLPMSCPSVRCSWALLDGSW